MVKPKWIWCGCSFRLRGCAWSGSTAMWTCVSRFQSKHLEDTCQASTKPLSACYQDRFFLDVFDFFWCTDVPGHTIVRVFITEPIMWFQNRSQLQPQTPSSEKGTHRTRWDLDGISWTVCSIWNRIPQFGQITASLDIKMFRHKTLREQTILFRCIGTPLNFEFPLKRRWESRKFSGPQSD
jgi:hypothetical protein